MKRVVVNGVAGLVATAVMTGAMLGMKKVLPVRYRYPLPPRLVTWRSLQRLGLLKHLKLRHEPAAVTAAHFGYGAAAGALYAPIAKADLNPLVAGSLYGLTVWAGSYFGLLPALGILPPAHWTPLHRNALMIAAHLVYGTTLAAIASMFETSGDPLERIELPADYQPVAQA